MPHPFLTILSPLVASSPSIAGVLDHTPQRLRLSSAHGMQLGGLGRSTLLELHLHGGNVLVYLRGAQMLGHHLGRVELTSDLLKRNILACTCFLEPTDINVNVPYF